MAEIRRPGSGRNSNVENQKNIFGAIPARAFPDARLAARHYKVLGAVAVHDRFGKNGQRCWAGRDRLAKLAGIAPNHVSDALGELEFYGYVKRQRHPMNRRTTIIRVLYSDEDAAAIKSERSGVFSANTRGGSRRTAADRSTITADESKATAEQVQAQKANALNADGFGLSNILSEALRINRAEASIYRTEARLPRKERVPDLGPIRDYLDCVEAAVNGTKPGDIDCAKFEIQKLGELAARTDISSDLRLRADSLRMAITEGKRL